MKNYIKNWIFDLVVGIISLVFGVLLCIPSIQTKIIGFIIGAILLVFFCLKVFPKLLKIKQLKAEWTIWCIIEAVLVIALVILAILNGTTNLKIGPIELQISHIVGILFILEGIMQIISICNRYHNNGKVRRIEKYIAIVLIIIGTYIASTVNISTTTIGYIVASICFVFTIVFIILMIKVMPKKKKIKK